MTEKGDQEPHPLQPPEPPESPQPPHSVFTKWQRIIYVYIASVAAFASPVSSSIYYPAMSTLAKDLDTSLTNISLTITMYMVFQGVAPTIIGGLSDRVGRRPAYLLSFTLFVAANIGLALQTNFAALMALRCLQSCGSSGTAALSSAVVSDVATRQERGSYIGLAALGSSMGPALGPLIGGLLDHFLGWRAIFWFLAIFGGVMLLVYALLMPETCRNIVGNGSLPPQRWNKPLIAYLPMNKSLSEVATANSSKTCKQRPGILSTLPILLDKESSLCLLFSGLLYAGYYIVLTGLPQQLESTYNYNSIQVGLCYLPMGIGPLLIRPSIGRIMDTNFHRHARKMGIEVAKNRQPDIDGFPIEKARLEVSLAFVYFSCVAIVPYGWVMWLHRPPLAAALVLLFILGTATAAAFQPLTALIIDINPRSPAAATAANQFARCLLGAGGVGVVNPMLDSLGRGWTSTLIALIWVVTSLCWWAVILWGPLWRKQKKEKNCNSSSE
ncbi:Fc.00g046240.m01.CDS01 [Cosmosporella sp. VM-42]